MKYFSSHPNLIVSDALSSGLTGLLTEELDEFVCILENSINLVHMCWLVFMWPNCVGAEPLGGLRWMGFKMDALISQANCTALHRHKKACMPNKCKQRP